MASAITEDFATCQPQRTLIWHRSAPRRLIEKSRPGDPLAGWTTWQKHLARRKSPQTPPFFAGKEPALLWGWPKNWTRDELVAEIDAPETAARDFSSISADSLELSHALQAVGLAYALPRLAGTLTADLWWRLAKSLATLATDAGQHRVDWQADPRDVVRNQLLAGELPLVLGYLFPELTICRELRNPAREALSEALVAVTDGKGLPHARLLPVLGALFACWTRCRWLGERMKRGCWSHEAEVQYLWLVRQAIRLTNGRGQFLFGENDDPSGAAALHPLFTTALELVGDKGDCALAAAMISKSVLPCGMKPRNKDLPKPALDSTWSGIAILTSNWSKSAARLAVTYAEDPMRIDFAIAGQQVFSGTIHTRTACDGQPVQSVGPWEQLCWHSDKYCDYLELAIDLSDGLRLERQLLLPRKDQVMLMADIILAGDKTPRQLRHTLCLPGGPNIRWQPEAETRDGVVVGKKLRMAVLPLALSEWRSDPRGGSLCEEAGRLTLTQECDGQAIYCPLFFDFNSGRTKEERTWRQLTVAESLAVVARDVAVAFRVQSGRDQWLVYRSLAPAANRTFMGQNISGEFCAGRFPKSGEIDEWIEVEADA